MAEPEGTREERDERPDDTVAGRTARLEERGARRRGGPRR